MLQIKRWNVALVAALSILVAAPAFAKTITKQARANDVATEYRLMDNGDLFRMVRGRKCQVTTNVLDFKVSQHPNDAAMAYYVRDENTPNLFVIHNTDRIGNCPTASKTRIASDLAKKSGDYRYNVVSNTDTTIVNVALTANGDFTAWENSNIVLTQKHVADYVMHQKYGVRGAPFSSYVLFAINNDGFVLKVKGETPSASKWDTSTWYFNLTEFKNKNRIE